MAHNLLTFEEAMYKLQAATVSDEAFVMVFDQIEEQLGTDDSSHVQDAITEYVLDCLWSKYKAEGHSFDVRKESNKALITLAKATLNLID